MRLVQVVKGASATQSGIYTLPFVLSLVVGSTLSGAFTQKVGYYVPAMIASPSLLATGQGLMSTFRVNESSSHWIGFQVIAGFGLGLGMQASSLAAQAVLPIPDVPIGIAIMFFAQQLGGGIFTSVGQNLLSTYLVTHLQIPGLSPDQITSEGATDLVSSVDPKYRLAVKTVYNEAISQIFRAAMGVALVAVVAALFMEWRNVKKVGAPGASPPGDGPDAGDQSPEPLRGEESPEPLSDASPRLSSENHSNFDRKYNNRIDMNVDALNVEEPHALSTPKPGCEHCEHCRLSRAITIAPSERQNLPHHTPHASSSSHGSQQQGPIPSPQALEEAARLASVARETVSKLEELTRPFSTPGVALTPPEQAYMPSYNRQRGQSFTSAETTSRGLRREPTTQELAENARRVSAQLEREDRESKILQQQLLQQQQQQQQQQHKEGWRDRHESWSRRSDQFSR